MKCAYECFYKVGDTCKFFDFSPCEEPLACIQRQASEKKKEVFPARPKPWTWHIFQDGEAYFYQILDANQNVLISIPDDNIDREQDLDEIIKCVNHYVEGEKIC